MQNQKPDAFLISKMAGCIKFFDRDCPSYTAGSAAEIAKADARLGEILALDERYGQAVREALNIEGYREPDNAKESEIRETAENLARQSARRAAEAAGRSRQAFEHYGNGGQYCQLRAIVLQGGLTFHFNKWG